MRNHIREAPKVKAESPLSLIPPLTKTLTRAVACGR
jgi:hypothetical protein